MKGEEDCELIKFDKDTVSFQKLISKEYLHEYFQLKQWRSNNHDALNLVSVIPSNDPDRRRFSDIFQRMHKQDDYNPGHLKLVERESRAVAALLGLGICDALGASTQFEPYDKKRRIIKKGFEDIQRLINQGVLQAREGTIGIWTDDCSMALCMADSLIINKYQFIPIHVRYMFSLWLYHGMNNGGRRYSIGLGGNIAISMSQFKYEQTDFAIEGDKFNNGNGSLMRLAPVPICFSQNQQAAMKFSGQASRTTHNGDQSKQCSKLLALILVRLINRGKKSWKECIDKACNDFKTDIPSVKYLALSKQQPQKLYEREFKSNLKFQKFNRVLEDRNWNWKDHKFTYSPTRAKAQPEYIGSYCMDALSMALHTVWHGKSFFQIALLNANIGGDSDTVGAVAGQIAGAIYGIDKQMLRLYSEMEDFKYKRYEVFLKAFKLFTHGKVSSA